MKGGDNLTRVSIHLNHESIGRSKMSHRLKVSNPIIKLKRFKVVARIFTDTKNHTFIVNGLGMTELRNLMGIMTMLTSLTRNLLTR